MSEIVTPQSELARRIASKLVAAQLIPKSHEDQAMQSIVNGRASADDWSLWVEMAAGKAADKDSNKGGSNG